MGSRFEEVVFALEDCRHQIRRLEADLLKADSAQKRPPEQPSGWAFPLVKAEVVTLELTSGLTPSNPLFHRVDGCSAGSIHGRD